MSVFNKSVVNIGDCVIIRFGHDKLIPKIVEKNKIDQTRFGAVRHDDLIGKEYGTKVITSKGFVHILPLTPEIWSYSLPHRTQIIYPHDCSLIIGQLDLIPGSKIIEAGTGSGSMTHHLARTVYPNGHVYTFEFHAERARLAAEEFKNHNLLNIVTSRHRDVIGEGFPEGLKVDAVMLDLPSPWSMIKHVAKVLVRGGRVCFFSPCIEQVQRTIEELHKSEGGNFVELETQTLLKRNYNIIKNNMEMPNIGQEFAESIPEDGFCGLEDNLSCHKKHRTKFLLDNGNERRYDAVPQNSTAGHSGYLTFATWIDQ